MQRSEIRSGESNYGKAPDCAALHPGYAHNHKCLLCALAGAAIPSVTPACGYGSRLALSLGRDDDESELAGVGKPLALDAGHQCRRADRGLLAQDHTAALRPLQPSA